MAAGILLLLVIVGFAAVHYVSGKIAEDATVSSGDPAAQFPPVACTADMVEASMSARIDIREAEKGKEKPDSVIFTVTLRNLSNENPCYIQVGRDAATIDITSGSDDIVSLATCEKSAAEHKQLLLDRSMETSFEWTWNGRRSEGCPLDGTLAKEGTYKGVWRTQGATTGEGTAVFVVPDLNPKPTPTESAQADTPQADGAAQPDTAAQTGAE